MALSREEYAAFEAVVGKRNISEDIAVLETYRCASAQSSCHYGPYDNRTPMPQAVILPGSTEEVSLQPPPLPQHQLYSRMRSISQSFTPGIAARTLRGAS